MLSWARRYPIIGPKAGGPGFGTVARSRPETMLGDTAVACHPDPERALTKAIATAQEKLDKAPAKEKDAAKKELERIQARKETHLQSLLHLRDMAADGRNDRPPPLDRETPPFAAAFSTTE